MTNTMQLHGQRGQTLPLWAVTTLVAMTLMLFVFNYDNTVRYSVRAQNAADSAAAAALGNDAAALNSAETLLAAFDIQELRVRDAEAALPTLLTGDTNCSGTTTSLLTQACTGDLVMAAQDTGNSLTTLGKVATTLNTFSGQLTNRTANPQTAIASLFAPNGAGGCAVAVLTDCDYNYSTSASQNANGMLVIDEYTCKKVTNLGAGFLHLPAANQTFYAIGHATSSLAPLQLNYGPTTLGPALASASSVFPDVKGDNVIGSLASLNVASNYYVPTAAGVPTTTKSLSAVCP